MITIHRKTAYLIAFLVLVTAHAVAQDPDPPIKNEYRFTQIVSKPVHDKVVLFTYSGVTNSPEKNLTSYYGSPPNLIYIPKPWVEIYAALIVVYTDNRRANDSWEFRPITGVKFYVPNDFKWRLYSWTRYEQRLIVQDEKLQNIPRLRNRFGIEAPLTKQEKAWTPKTYYVMADVEPVYRLDTNRLQFVRIRGALGYIFNKKWRAELMYFHESSGTQNEPFDHTGNLFRLNIKLALPRRSVQHTSDVDID